MDDSGSAMDAFNSATENRDVRAIKNACMDITQPLTIRLPAALPTPDLDLTNALQILVGNGNDLAIKCADLIDPPSPDQLRAISAELRNMGSTGRFASNLMKRDGSILQAAGR